ncbi:P-type conjugative transfer protein TrbG [Sphingomonas sp. KC8]|uniref:P-type conjugative transfer protein TrbG n=1 Tax=Sphingomonas sp. KC8 TaxID=1030157 RepID=UPI000248AB86|nr:P-type conjugative transfer protein TrbG [Sphingomonas sp. KC8]ARS26982.1 conjugal transfer protein TrbG [Sphingomonas sp. KC8]
MMRPLALSASLLTLLAAEPLPAAPPRGQNPDTETPTARVRSANHAALREPSIAGYINAVQVYPYGEGVLYRLYAAPERVTDIVLQPGETVTAVAAGDTVRWTIGDTTSGNGDTRRTHILVKPFAAGLRTNIVITTDRRAYHLQLESTLATAMTAISWTYPDDALLALRRSEIATAAAAPVATGLAIEKLSFGYTLSGDDPPWRPLRAFDDGQQTFIEFPASISVGEVPPLFVIAASGDASLVNYRMAGRYYVVDRLFDAAELRLGAKDQQIVRISRDGSERRGQRRRRAS